MPRVLLTGANGFIGRNLLPFLITSGVDVRAAVRHPLQETYVDTVLIDDLSATTDWAESVHDVGVVVHLAARAHRSSYYQEIERADYKRINVDGAVSLGYAAAEAGVRHFIFVSTIGVNGRHTDDRDPFSEEDTPNPDGVYAETKALAEERLTEISAASGMGLTIIRPVVVYGPNVKANVHRLAEAVRRGLPLPLAQIRNRRAVLASDNLNSFILHRISAAPKGVEKFLLADDEQVSTPEFVRRIGRAVQRDPLLIPFPPQLLRRALSAVGRKSMAESLISSLEVSTARAQQTGWRPIMTMQEALNKAFK